MRHTVIRTINNRRVIIPNSQMNSYTIENFNYIDNENVKLVDFSISYESDVDKAMKIIKDEMKKLYKPNEKVKIKMLSIQRLELLHGMSLELALELGFGVKIMVKYLKICIN